MSDPVVMPVDQPLRQQALDVANSFIIQAPAGSGKTELLIQRTLALLGVAGQPEEILALTFTRKAAAEMHRRLLESLERASREAPPDEAHALQTWSLAAAALERDKALGWGLLDNPSRLQIMTIDSFCATLVRRMPWLARFGDVPAIAEDPNDLYRCAAERLLMRLERGGVGCAAIERLLAHLDNRLPLLRDLLMAMLGRRDQWLRHLDSAHLAGARPELEGALIYQVSMTIAELRASLDDAFLAELVSMGAWAAARLASNGETSLLSPLLGRDSPPEAAVDKLPAWLALAHLVLTKDGEVRKSINRTLGFPSGGDPEAAKKKAQLVALLERLRAMPETVRHFQALRHLPAIAYSDEQWQALSALIELLPLAVQELRDTFRAMGQTDFAEITAGALSAIGEDLAPGDLLLHLDSSLRHILVDEFQDTSRAQFELLSRLVAGWEPGDGRTLFLVGDPMQSIYRFREAEVGLFLRVRHRGFDPVRLTPIVLQANFRSQASLITWHNRTFAKLFPKIEDEVRGAVPFAAAAATRTAVSGPAVTCSCFETRDDAAEAAQIVALIRESQLEDPTSSIAVLVRSRSHLTALVPVLKESGLTWQAQELEPLTDRPVVRDLLALTRALLHPADRVAWLSVLRAPWCGLCLDDLLSLCGSRPKATVWECLTDPDKQLQLIPTLSADGIARLAKIIPVLRNILADKGRVPLRRLVEAAWIGINGPAGLAAADLDDAEQFLDLLEELDMGGDLLRLEDLPERLGKLFAATDPQAGPGLQLLTIHKAKGLEFDTVILPGLGRPVRGPDRALLLWQELPDPVRARAGLLLAPLPATSSDEHDPTYRAIARIHADKDALETLRLFYVAATRARRRLHLLGHARPGEDGRQIPAAGSLLKSVWPALATDFAAHRIPRFAVDGLQEPYDLVLRRLPSRWTAPKMAAQLQTAYPRARRASDSGHVEGGSLRISLRCEEGRIVGNAVHGWLERLAIDGLDQWPDERFAGIHALLRGELLSDGVPRSRVDACAARAVSALLNTVHSPRGRWFLAGHTAAATELAITGKLDGIPVHAVIDRAFIDEHGVRWVIDYKCSCPAEGEAVEMFLAAEIERYRDQLSDYRRLMRLLEPEREVRGALYFPLLDAWCELEWAGLS